MQFEFLTVDMDPCPAEQRPVFFGFECPKNPGRMCTGLVLRDNPAGLKPEKATWIWNGNREKPTFQPSINCMKCSHGFIENGVWRDA